MKLQELTPALKPGLILATINTVLCLLFGFGAFVAIGLGAALLELWNLPLPLFPFVVLGAIPVTLIAWSLFAFRLDQTRTTRWAIAFVGTLPLQAVVMAAIFFAIWFVAMPTFTAATVTSALVTLLIATVATLACGAMVIFFHRNSSESAEANGSPTPGTATI